MHAAIESFIQYAGLSGLKPDDSGCLSMQLEAGTIVSIEPDMLRQQLILSILHPCPWTLFEMGERALRRIHYRKSPNRAIAAGAYGDRLVLSTRLGAAQQTPQEIERAIHELLAFADQCKHANTPEQDSTQIVTEMHGR